MVDLTDTNATAGLNRLITFELDADETLLVRAGRDEMDNRVIYSGRAGGRYAIVPVDELEQQARASEGVPVELDVEGLQLVGDTVTLPRTGEQNVGLHTRGEQIVRMDRAGAYGLLWIPVE